MDNNIVVNNKKHIDAFTSIRGFWAITIVISHIYSLYESQIGTTTFRFLGNGGFGVACFFVLSGFLSCMHYNNTYSEEANIKDGLVFALRHAKKWYLLHLICMVPFLLLNIINIVRAFDFLEVVKLGIKLILNIFLIQTWIPGIELSINGVAWFVSCLSFIYIFTPIILFLNKKIKDNHAVSILLIALFLVIIWVFGGNLNLYNHPFYRIFQFAIGILLFNLKDMFGGLKSKIWVVLALSLQVFGYLMLIPGRSSLVNTLIIIVFIIVFYNSFKLKIFSNKTMLQLGNYSMEIFLIHFPVVCIGKTVLGVVFSTASPVIICIEMFGLFIASIILSIFYKKVIANLSFVVATNKKIIGVIDLLVEVL